MWAKVSNNVIIVCAGIPDEPKGQASHFSKHLDLYEVICGTPALLSALDA